MVELGQHIAHIVPAADWRTIQPLFHNANRGDGPFDIAVRDAARMAQIFRTAAASPRMPAFWAVSARELAVVAERHASNGQPWSWY
jgi:hypothetical protein